MIHTLNMIFRRKQPTFSWIETTRSIHSTQTSPNPKWQWTWRVFEPEDVPVRPRVFLNLDRRPATILRWNDQLGEEPTLIFKLEGLVEAPKILVRVYRTFGVWKIGKITVLLISTKNERRLVFTREKFETLSSECRFRLSNNKS